MIAVLQRVESASVEVDGCIVARIGKGILVLAAALRGDRHEDVGELAQKIVGYRIFEDNGGKMNLNIHDVGGEIMVVSQFTLAADGEKGRRPSFDGAMLPAQARPFVDRLAETIRDAGVRVVTGEFGARMRVSLVNDGPATFVLSRPRRGDPAT